MFLQYVEPKISTTAVPNICSIKPFTQELDQSTMFLHLTFMFWRASRRIDAGNLQLVQAALQKQLNANRVEFCSDQTRTLAGYFFWCTIWSF
jgi:hypothetical protein